MEITYCKNCTHYKNIFENNHKECELLEGLFQAEENDFCSFASTESNEDAGFDCDYQGIHCNDCTYYDGFDCLQQTVFQNDGKEFHKCFGLFQPQEHDYCSRAERRED